MKFSILIPVYNVENYLEDCLNSVDSQTYKNYEVIIIDDGSTDNSPLICDEYKKGKENVKVIHQKNHGLLYTRRIAFKHATGDYCIVLDSDDFLDCNALSILYKNIKKYNPDLILFNGLKYYNGKTYIHKKPLYDKDIVKIDEKAKEDLYNKLLERKMSNTLWSKVAKKSIIDVNQDYSKYYDVNMGEDLIQSLPLLTNAKNIIYINQNIYYYRTNLASLTQKYNPNGIKSLLKVNKSLDYYASMWEIEDADSKCANRFLIDIYDLYTSVIKTNDKSIIQDFIKEVSGNEYYIKKYEISKHRKLNILQNITNYLIYNKKIQLCILWSKILRKYYIRKLKKMEEKI